MLFIPWIYLRQEAQRTPSHEIAAKARYDEITLIKSLADSADTAGVIGIEAGAKLQRLPSAIYWSGLGRWGIRRFEGSQDQYHRNLNRFYARRKDSPGADADAAFITNWDPGLPPPPAEFPRRASLRLSPPEADYLRERIMTACRGTVLAHLVDQTKPVRVDYIWMHPELGGFPAKLQMVIEHARNFSALMHGAALLYNLLLAEASRHEARISGYRARLDEWADRLAQRAAGLADWDRRQFWSLAYRENPKIPHPTCRFINRWLDIVQPDAASNVASNQTARALIREREIAIKRGRARLANQRALNMWSGAAGTGRLDYRWHVVNTIVNDILTGLKGVSDA